ncbi:MAG: tRNA (adenosine(37)-N6)-threonylcarbamoyltransferase complex transferase subunit TsaD, partial [Candidatus Omnitrophica bacterium]|nr:tRNA (adenosine(37)-N6)-threonylcarbamoyltransferase complex transferase subunit TsaD [Candidatus Omnitrophota bacterium]
LVGALLVGISLAKSISYSLGLPIVGVNHILAHLYSSFLNEDDKPDFPHLGLVVSGGHTALFHCEGAGRQRLLGQTQDDAVGEAYDKVAKLLGLGYPGGPVIEKTARLAKRINRINFPKSYLGKDSLDFSFSGIKTAVLYYSQKVKELNKDIVADICCAFQEAALDILVEKAILAARITNCSRIVVGGGVAANGRLREKLTTACEFSSMNLHFPELKYCLDNAAMVGALGEELYRKGLKSDLYLTAVPNLEVS